MKYTACGMVSDAVEKNKVGEGDSERPGGGEATDAPTVQAQLSQTAAHLGSFPFLPQSFCEVWAAHLAPGPGWSPHPPLCQNGDLQNHHWL